MSEKIELSFSEAYIKEKVYTASGDGKIAV